MNKMLIALMLLGFSSMSYATTYTCYRYVNGEPTGTWISVDANSKSEAESKAYARMKKLGGQVDYAKCR